MIGGVSGITGFMSDPDFAALDPIFWLHHCNIDRLWAAWLDVSTNTQENGVAWSAGPVVPKFTLPDVNGQLKGFTPADALPDGPLAPTYDDLVKGTGIVPGGAMAASLSGRAPPTATLIGASVTDAKVAPGASFSAHLGVSSANVPAGLVSNRFYLNVENIRGERPSGVLDIHIGLKGASEKTPGTGDEYVDSLPLFGLKNATNPNGPHGGNGLTMVLDITDAVSALQRNASASLDDLEVTITQPATGEGTAPISVGRVSVYSAPDE
jgi:tyrosinase